MVLALYPSRYLELCSRASQSQVPASVSLRPILRFSFSAALVGAPPPSPSSHTQAFRSHTRNRTHSLSSPCRHGSIPPEIESTNCQTKKRSDRLGSLARPSSEIRPKQASQMMFRRDCITFYRSIPSLKSFWIYSGRSCCQKMNA